MGENQIFLSIHWIGRSGQASFSNSDCFILYPWSWELENISQTCNLLVWSTEKKYLSLQNSLSIVLSILLIIYIGLKCMLAGNGFQIAWWDVEIKTLAWLITAYIFRCLLQSLFFFLIWMNYIWKNIYRK